jgi:hypothetical protein
MDATLPPSKAPRFNGHPVVLLLRTSQLAGCRGIVSLGSTCISTRVTSFKYIPLAIGSCVLPVSPMSGFSFYILTHPLLASRTGLDEGH